MSCKVEFLNLFRTCVKREGADKLLEYLTDKTDFFTAPASTRFHLSEEGGLVKHSINVYRNLKEASGVYSLETIAICGLLHDVCKTNYYKNDYKNAKNAQGVWERVPFYSVDDKFPYGHGEKSVFIIERFMKLTGEEALAIRWHMGGFDEAPKRAGEAFGTCRLAVLLHIADLQSAYLNEVQVT